MSEHASCGELLLAANFMSFIGTRTVETGQTDLLRRRTGQFDPSTAKHMLVPVSSVDLTVWTENELGEGVTSWNIELFGPDDQLLYSITWLEGLRKFTTTYNRDTEDGTAQTPHAASDLVTQLQQYELNNILTWQPVSPAIE